MRCVHAEPFFRDAPPHVNEKMLRQVSWLTGHHFAPAFPVIDQWQDEAKTLRLQLRGQLRIHAGNLHSP